MDNYKILKALNEFRKVVDEAIVGQTPKLTGEMDELYDCDIYIFRHPGMGNSKQVIVGDPLGIWTATASYLETLLRQGIVTEEQLHELVNLSIKGFKGEFE